MPKNTTFSVYPHNYQMKVKYVAANVKKTKNCNQVNRNQRKKTMK